MEAAGGAEPPRSEWVGGEDRGSFTLTSFSNTQLPRKKQDPPQGKYRTPAGWSQHEDGSLAASMN